jgi:GxxExxY protein
MEKCIYPELSYKIVGCLYEVFNLLGPNRREKFYQRALAKEFDKNKIAYKEQIVYNVSYKSEIIGKDILDFLVEDVIIVELKSKLHFSKSHFIQITEYLKNSKLKLGILVNFTDDGVKFRRVLNLYL